MMGHSFGRACWGVMPSADTVLWRAERGACRGKICEACAGGVGLCGDLRHGDLKAECLDPALEPFRLNGGIVT